MNENANKTRVDMIEQLRKNWFVFVFIGGLITGWTNIKGDLKVNEKEINQIKVDQVAIDLKVDNYQKQVLDISGDIKAIKESLTFIRERIK